MIEEMMLNQADEKLLEQLDDLRFGNFAKNLDKVKRQSYQDFNKVHNISSNLPNSISGDSLMTVGSKLTGDQQSKQQSTRKVNG